MRRGRRRELPRPVLFGKNLVIRSRAYTAEDHSMGVEGGPSPAGPGSFCRIQFCDEHLAGSVVVTGAIRYVRRRLRRAAVPAELSPGFNARAHVGLWQFCLSRLSPRLLECPASASCG